MRALSLGAGKEIVAVESSLVDALVQGLDLELGNVATGRHRGAVGDSVLESTVRRDVELLATGDLDVLYIK